MMSSHIVILTNLIISQLRTQENSVHKPTLNSKMTGRGNSLEKVFVILLHH